MEQCCTGREWIHDWSLVHPTFLNTEQGQIQLSPSAELSLGVHQVEKAGKFCWMNIIRTFCRQLEGSSKGGNAASSSGWFMATPALRRGTETPTRMRLQQFWRGRKEMKPTYNKKMQRIVLCNNFNTRELLSNYSALNLRREKNTRVKSRTIPLH